MPSFEKDMQQNSNGGKAKEGQEGCVQLIVSGSDSAKPLDFLKETLKEMPLLVKISVSWPGNRNVALGRDHAIFPML